MTVIRIRIGIDRHRNICNGYASYYDNILISYTVTKQIFKSTFLVDFKRNQEKFEVLRFDQFPLKRSQ